MYRIINDKIIFINYKRDVINYKRFLLFVKIKIYGNTQTQA